MVSELVIALDTTADELLEELTNIVTADLEKMAEVVSEAEATTEETKAEEKELVEA